MTNNVSIATTTEVTRALLNKFIFLFYKKHFLQIYPSILS